MNSNGKNHDKLAVVITITVVLVWLLAIAGGIYRQDWTALNIITPVLLTALGWLYIRRNGKNGQEK
jgi:hypothetical protein